MVNSGIDAVGYRNIDEPEFPRYRNSRFGSQFCERLQSRASPAAENQCKHPVHAYLHVIVDFGSASFRSTRCLIIIYIVVFWQDTSNDF